MPRRSPHDGVGGSIVERIPLVAVSRHGKRVQFAGALEPVLQDRAPVVASVTVERLSGAFRITVERGETRDTMILTDQNALEVRSDDGVVLASGDFSGTR